MVMLFTDGAYDVESADELLSPEWLCEQVKSRANLPIKTTFDEILAHLRALNGVRVGRVPDGRGGVRLDVPGLEVGTVAPEALAVRPSEA